MKKNSLTILYGIILLLVSGCSSTSNIMENNRYPVTNPIELLSAAQIKAILKNGQIALQGVAKLKGRFDSKLQRHHFNEYIALIAWASGNLKVKPEDIVMVKTYGSHGYEPDGKIRININDINLESGLLHEFGHAGDPGLYSVVRVLKRHAQHGFDEVDELRAEFNVIRVNYVISKAIGEIAFPNLIFHPMAESTVGGRLLYQYLGIEEEKTHTDILIKQANSYFSLKTAVAQSDESEDFKKYFFVQSLLVVLMQHFETFSELDEFVQTCDIVTLKNKIDHCMLKNNFDSSCRNFIDKVLAYY